VKKIAWIMRLPEEEVKVVVRNGDKVSEGEVVYELKGGNRCRLPLAGWRDLGVKEREEIEGKVTGRHLVKDELLWGGSWFYRRQLRSPLGGKCLGIDELGNIMFEDELKGKCYSPISSSKIRVEKDKIVFELRGWEKGVIGVSEVKGWGEFRGGWVKNLSEMSSDILNQMVVIEGEEAMVAKAEALGVKGIILVDMEIDADWKEAEIPIVKMEKEEVKDLIKLSLGSVKSKMWLNPISGRVLLVIE
jgi:hypothetical protein